VESEPVATCETPTLVFMLLTNKDVALFRIRRIALIYQDNPNLV
jgi:hypothetical protein